jgi:hypothetical protein
LKLLQCLNDEKLLPEKGFEVICDFKQWDAEEKLFDDEELG